MSAVAVDHALVGEKWDWPLQGNDGIVKITNTPEKFEVGLDVQCFSPNEIEVKVSGQDLFVHCRHEARKDEYGTVSREINRTYHLPADVDASSLKSHLTARGVLNIVAAKRK